MSKSSRHACRRPGVLENLLSGHSAAFFGSGTRTSGVRGPRLKECWRFLSEGRRIAYTDGHLRDWMSLLSGLRIKTKELYLYARVGQSPRPFQRPREYTASPTSQCCGVLCLQRPGWNLSFAMAVLRRKCYRSFSFGIATWICKRNNRGIFASSCKTSFSVSSPPAVLKYYGVECCPLAVCRREGRSSQISRPLWHVCRLTPMYDVSF